MASHRIKRARSSDLGKNIGVQKVCLWWEGRFIR